MAPPLKVFLSYKWEDESPNQWVRHLATDLRHASIDAKLDIWEVRYGDSFPDYMTSKIQDADAVLFIMTPASVAAVEAPQGQGGAVKFEMQRATARRTAGTARLIGIYRGGDKTPAHFLDHRYADFRDDAAYEQNLQALVDDLLGRIIIPPVGRSGIEWASQPNREPAEPVAVAPFSPGEAKQHQHRCAEHLGADVEITNTFGMMYRPNTRHFARRVR